MDIAGIATHSWQQIIGVNHSNCARKCCELETFPQTIILMAWSIIGSDNGLSPVRRQAIIWTNDGLLSIRLQGTNTSEILIEIQTFFINENTFQNVVGKMAAILSRTPCLKWIFFMNYPLDLYHYMFISLPWYLIITLGTKTDGTWN